MNLFGKNFGRPQKDAHAVQSMYNLCFKLSNIIAEDEVPQDTDYIDYLKETGKYNESEDFERQFEGLIIAWVLIVIVENRPIERHITKFSVFLNENEKYAQVALGISKYGIRQSYLRNNLYKLKNELNVQTEETEIAWMLSYVMERIDKYGLFVNNLINRRSSNEVSEADNKIRMYFLNPFVSSPKTYDSMENFSTINIFEAFDTAKKALM